jgi:hypothetical protein
MWCAMGQCYEHEQLGLNDAAIRCYRRALANGEREGIALHKLVRAGTQAARPDRSPAGSTEPCLQRTAASCAVSLLHMTCCNEGRCVRTVAPLCP